MAMVIALGSCVTHRDLTYLRSTTDQKSYKLAEVPPYRIRSGDNLYIRVVGWEEKTFEFFNPSNNQQNTFSREYFHFNGYVVDENGYIGMPVLGKIHVEGLTINETRDTIQNKVSEYLKEGKVIVKLANFYITIIGEVGNAQQLHILEENTTIFEALAQSSGINPAGNRRTVKLIRNINDTLVTYHLDLTDDRLLEDELLFVRPRDMIYVEPMKARILTENMGRISGTLSLVFSIITLISVLNL